MLAYRWRKLKHFGLAVQCSICRSYLKGFIKHGQDFEILKLRQVVGGIALSDYCPICYGASRTRLIHLYLKNRLRYNCKTLRILHFAPELGLANWLDSRSQVVYIPCDPNPLNFNEIRNIREISLPDTSFAANSFDIVVCSHVLEHVIDDRAAMREIFRILDYGGVALFMVPEATDGLGTDEDISLENRQEREKRFGQNDHVRLYERNDFTNRLLAAGFQVAEFDPYSENQNIGPSIILNPCEILRISKKM
jgi:SAM-dependent methyltransferase